MKLILSSFFLLLLAPCNHAQKLQAGATNDYSHTTIVYAETPCFGQCPVFEMTLNGATLIATFIGKENSEKIGTYTKNISNEEFSSFMEALEKAQFNKLNNEYMGRVPDFPVKEITVTKDGKTKKVRDRSEAPDALEVMEQVFKRFAVSDGWTKTGD